MESGALGAQVGVSAGSLGAVADEVAAAATEFVGLDRDDRTGEFAVEEVVTRGSMAASVLSASTSVVWVRSVARTWSSSKLSASTVLVDGRGIVVGGGVDHRDS